MLRDDLVKFANWKREDLLHLAETTGAIENWFRAEVAIAAKKGFFGSVQNVRAERGHSDLTLEYQGKQVTIEFKVAFNNKNLLGGYNGTGGITKDLLKLRADTSNNEKYVAVFFAFYRKTGPNSLPPSYTNTAHGTALQPPAGMPFEDFAPQLADQILHHGLNHVVPSPGRVNVLESADARWLGFWCYRVA